MREKLQTLSLAQLKEMAKAQKIKGASTMRKAELINVLCKIAEQEDILKTAVAPPRYRNAESQESERVVTAADTQEMRTESQAGDMEERRTERNFSAANSRQEGISAESGQPERVSSMNSSAGTFYSRSDNYSYNNRQDTNSGAPSYNRYNNYGNRMDNNNGGYVRRDNSGSYNRNDNNSGSSYNRNDNNNGTYNRNDNNRPDYRQNSTPYRPRTPRVPEALSAQEVAELDSGQEANGILEVMPDGFGFIRGENFLPGDNDVYVAPSQIRRFNLKTGDIIVGNRRVKSAAEKFAALLYIRSVNGYPISVVEKRPNFEDLTPIFPKQRLHMESIGRSSTAMRIVDLLTPIGKGQRGLIVSPPKAGKTTLLKQIAQAITVNHPDMHMIILLIDERPEEVTDMRESVTGDNVEVIYSTFDELPERHKRVSEMVIERARRLVEHGRDVIILLDSITRLARAYNLVVPPSGRTLSGGLDPAALHMPKRFFGAARNIREGGSLTILATGLVETGSRMDDVIYEEFKGTGNMELVLDRKLSEKRIFPAIDILKSSTRRDDLLLSQEEAETVEIVRRATSVQKPEEAVERILDLFAKTKTNKELIENIKKTRFF
ncbi:MAG: transcription termination factor Rho [Clostridiales bacterium]|nr:transcription termination factor Rho [Clostridiales bacterium]